MNNFEKIKNMSVEEFINSISTGIFGEWNKTNVTNWLKQEEIDWTKIPKDTKVWVRDYVGAEWKPRYFATYNACEKDYPYSVYPHGATSWGNSDNGSLAQHKYCKLVKDIEEITYPKIQKELDDYCGKYDINCLGCKYKREDDCRNEWFNDNFIIIRK